MENIFLVLGLVGIGCGVMLMVAVEAKLIGLLVSGVGVLFVVLNFYSDFQANQKASKGNFEASQARVLYEYSKAAGQEKSVVDELEKKAKQLEASSDTAKSERKMILEKNEKERQPLRDALTSEVNKTSEEVLKSNSQKSMID